MRTFYSLSAGLVLVCLSACRPAMGAESGTPATQKTEKQDDEVWLWAVGPGWRIKGDKCSEEQLIDFYGARCVMYFDDTKHFPHTPGVANRLAGAEKLVLSLSYTDQGSVLESLGPCQNLKGVIIDDFSSDMANYKPEFLADAHRRLKASDPRLNLYTVIYTMHFDKDFKPFLPSIDVVSLWVWDSKDLADLDRHLERCRKIFPGKPIVLGLYLFDWSHNREMPMDLLQWEFRKARDYTRQGLITGYQVLGSYRPTELQTPQARWVRDFIHTAPATKSPAP